MAGAITRRDFLNAMGAAPAALAFAGRAVAAQADGRPNIVLFLTDDALWSEYQFHNPEGVYTPSFKRLADEGVRFTRCYCAGSSCSPARFSLFTGRRPSTAIDPGTLAAARHRNGYVRFSNSGKALLHEDNVARVLRDAGYLTCIIGKTDGIDKSGDYHKIDPAWDPDDPEVARKLEENQRLRQKQMRHFGFDHPLYVHRGNIQPHFATRKNAVHNVEHMTSKALEFLGIAQRRRKPFFLVYSTSMLHAPNEYDSLTKGSPLATEAGSLTQPPTGVQPSRRSCIDRVKARGLPPRSAAPALWIDDALTAILAKLRSMGADENTLVVLHNDNGHDNHGKDSAYHDGFHVPLVVRWPKGVVRPGRKDEHFVRSFDLVPTFMELAKARRPEGMLLHGRSIVPLLRGRAPRDWRDSVFMSYGFARVVQRGAYRYIAVRFPDNHETNPLAGKPGKPLAAKHKKLLARAGNRKGMTHGRAPTKAELNHYEVHGESYFDADQLYDIRKDPLERSNLAADANHAGVLKEMRKLLRQYLQRVPGPFGEFKTQDPEYTRFRAGSGASPPST